MSACSDVCIRVRACLRPILRVRDLSIEADDDCDKSKCALLSGRFCQLLCARIIQRQAAHGKADAQMERLQTSQDDSIGRREGGISCDLYGMNNMQREGAKGRGEEMRLFV